VADNFVCTDPQFGRQFILSRLLKILFVPCLKIHETRKAMNTNFTKKKIEQTFTLASGSSVHQMQCPFSSSSLWISVFEEAGSSEEI